MEYRCVNDLFNYCSGEPQWGKPPKALGPGLYSAGSCKLDPKTCGKHQTLLEQLGNRLTQLKPAATRRHQLPREGTGKPRGRKRSPKSR